MRLRFGKYEISLRLALDILEIQTIEERGVSWRGKWVVRTVYFWPFEIAFDKEIGW